MTRFSLLMCFTLSLIPCGCQPASGPQNSENSGTTTVPADDPAAVAALEKAGCSLQRDKAGNVSEISVSSDVDFTETLKQLDGLHSVTVARFGGPGMNDTGMAAFSSLKTLKRLDLTDASGIGDATLQIVGQLTNLEALILRRAGFSDEGLSHIQGLTKLRAIDLRNSNVTDAGVAKLSGIKSLVDVQLEKSKVTDACVQHLKGLPLKSLNLNYTAVTDAAMPAIGDIATLEQLQLEASRLTDAGMADIARLKKLKRLGCRLADVTGAGIQHLAACTELTRLELRETSIDDDGLEVVSQLPKLTWLDISECRLVTANGYAKLPRLNGLPHPQPPSL